MEGRKIQNEKIIREQKGKVRVQRVKEMKRKTEEEEEEEEK